MRRFNACLKFMMVAVLVGMIACTSSGSRSLMDEESSNKSYSSDQNYSLADHLRRINGVTVRGTGDNITVNIRTNLSLGSNTNTNREPLYVIDDQEIGHSYREAARLAPKGSIKSVKVLPPSQAAIYGSEGGAGVIIIETR